MTPPRTRKRLLILGVAVLALAAPLSLLLSPGVRERLWRRWQFSRLASAKESERDAATRTLLEARPVDPESFAEVVAAYVRATCSHDGLLQDGVLVLVVHRFVQPPKPENIRASVPVIDGAEYVHSTGVLRTVWRSPDGLELDRDAIVELWSRPTGWPWEDLSRGEGQVELVVLKRLHRSERATVRSGGATTGALIRMWRPARIHEAALLLAVPLEGATGDLIVERVSERLTSLPREAKRD